MKIVVLPDERLHITPLYYRKVVLDRHRLRQHDESQQHRRFAAAAGIGRAPNFAPAVWHFGHGNESADVQIRHRNGAPVQCRVGRALCENTAACRPPNVQRGVQRVVCENGDERCRQIFRHAAGGAADSEGYVLVV